MQEMKQCEIEWSELDDGWPESMEDQSYSGDLEVSRKTEGM